MLPAFAPGTDPSLITSDTIQAAHDSVAALVANGVGAALYLPAITYQRLSKPLRFHASNVRIYGAGMHQTVLPISSGFGPMIFCGVETGVPSVTGLDGSPHLAWQFRSADRNWFSFHEAPLTCHRLHGASQFCWQMRLRPDVNGANDGALMASSGRLTSLDSVTSCYVIEIVGTNVVKATLTTSGGVFVATASAGLPFNATTIVTVDYDGSALRVIYGNTVMATTTATGTLVRGQWEAHTMGMVDFQGLIDGQFTGGSSSYTCDHVAVSIVSHWNGSVAAAITQDANLQLYLSFDQPPWGNMVQGFDGTATRGYFVYRKQQDLDASHQISGLEVADLGLAGAGNENGLYVWGTLSSTFSRLRVTYNGAIGIANYGNSYYNRYEKCELVGGRSGSQGGLAGMLFADQSGLNKVDQPNIHTSSPFPIAIEQSAGGLFLSPQITPESGVQAALLVNGYGGGAPPQAVFDSLQFDAEGNGADTITAWARVVDCPQITLRNAEPTLDAQPWPIIDWQLGDSGIASSAVLFEGCEFSAIGNSTALIKVTRKSGLTGRLKSTRIGCTALPSGVPAAVDPDSVINTTTDV